MRISRWCRGMHFACVFLIISFDFVVVFVCCRCAVTKIKYCINKIGISLPISVQLNTDNDRCGRKRMQEFSMWVISFFDGLQLNLHVLLQSSIENKEEKLLSLYSKWDMVSDFLLSPQIEWNALREVSNGVLFCRAMRNERQEDKWIMFNALKGDFHVAVKTERCPHRMQRTTHSIRFFFLFLFCL